MSDAWRCAVCEAVNRGGRSCSACGAPLTRRSAVATAVRGRVADPTRRHARPELDRPTLPDPVRRAISRGPVEDDEWALFDTRPRFDVMPLPGGCLFSVGPRRRRRWFL